MIGTRNQINNDILSGYYPQKNIMVLSNYVNARKEDVFKPHESDIRGILSALANEGYLLRMLDYAARAKCEIENRTEDDEIDEGWFFWINTLYAPKTFFSVDFCEEASKSIPVVTELDYLFYYWGMNFFALGGPDSDAVTGFFVYIIRYIQNKERSTRRTLNCRKIVAQDVYEFVFGDWTQLDDSFALELSREEENKLTELYIKRENYRKEIEKELDEEEEYAEKTESEWRTFIAIANHFSNSEKSAIKVVLESDDYEEKSQSIKKHLSLYQKLKEGQMVFSHENVDWTAVRDSVNERYKRSRRFCSVAAGDERAFVLNSSLVQMLEALRSYNAPFLLFHQFRLSRQKADAESFFKIALESVAHNFMTEVEDCTSIEQTCQMFLECFQWVLEDTKYLNGLSYDELIRGTALTGISVESVMMELYLHDMSSAMNEIVQAEIGSLGSLADNYWLADVVSEVVDKQEIIHNKIIERIEKTFGISVDDNWHVIEKDEETVEYSLMVRQIVRSLDVLYLFCDAIKILISNNPIEKFGVNDVSELIKTRDRLLDIDDLIIHKVYGGLEGRVRAIRENSGVKSDLLVERERNQEEISLELRNHEISEVITNIINDTVEMLEYSSEENIQNERTTIWREHLLKLPPGIPLAAIEDKLELLNRMISEKLIRLKKEEGEDFEAVRESLRSFFGDSFLLIPSTAVDTFVTAELLFHKYATPEYENRGFDYSSISALYYQAFETMYNDLVWKGYARELNELNIDGDKFGVVVAILWKSKDSIKTDEEKKEYRLAQDLADKYVDLAPKSRGNIAVRKGKCISIKEYCTYGYFSKLLSTCVIQNNYSGFSAYLARVFGFDNKRSMSNDRAFMDKLKGFVNSVSSAADDRNNASHGGIIIPLEQCEKDKSRILNKLADERKTNLGLALQLLDLYNNIGEGV